MHLFTSIQAVRRSTVHFRRRKWRSASCCILPNNWMFFFFFFLLFIVYFCFHCCYFAVELKPIQSALGQYYNASVWRLIDIKQICWRKGNRLHHLAGGCQDDSSPTSNKQKCMQHKLNTEIMQIQPTVFLTHICNCNGFLPVSLLGGACKHAHFRKVSGTNSTSNHKTRIKYRQSRCESEMCLQFCAAESTSSTAILFRNYRWYFSSQSDH